MRYKLLFLLFFVSQVFSQQLNSQSYTFDVTSSGFVEIYQVLNIKATENSFTFLIPFPIEKQTFRAYSYDTKIVARVEEVSDKTIVYIEVEDLGEIEVVFEYVTIHLTEKEEKWILYIPELEGKVKVLMPKNSEILYYVSKEEEFPRIKEEGGRIVLEWEKVDDEIFIYYKTEFEKSSENYYLAFIPVILVLFSIFYLTKKRRKKKLNRAILEILDSRERSIVEYLYNHGKTRQAKISKKTNIPKTSLSKIVRRMEERGILRVERDGRLSFCELDDSIFE